MGYSFRLIARVLLYAPSHKQDSSYYGLCYTSRGALAGTKNSSMGPPHEGSIRWQIALWANALTTELHLAPSHLKVHMTAVNTNKQWLTCRQRFGLEDLKELGQIGDDGQFVWDGRGRHVIPGHHGGNPELLLSDTKRQLAVLAHIRLYQLVKLSENKYNNTQFSVFLSNTKCQLAVLAHLRLYQLVKSLKTNMSIFNSVSETQMYELFLSDAKCQLAVLAHLRLYQLVELSENK